jgi:peptidoglycan/xylan/chitin deacetylase (PgdA/CDA1 family)
MRPFLVCLHDASPCYARETRLVLEGLAPLVGRRLSVGVVPNWHGGWPIGAHPNYCRMVHEFSEEILLHGYFHRRARGSGPTSLLTGGSDEMNGLDPAETRAHLERGQRDLIDAFGEPARGFLPPAWQMGHVADLVIPGRGTSAARALGELERPAHADDAAEHGAGGAGGAGHAAEATLGLEHLVGYFAIASRTRPAIPVATCSWDAGRWGWLGHVGDAFGRLLHSLAHRTPSLAIHPRDLQRGFWPAILRLIENLLARGYEPVTCSALLEGRNAQAAL